MFFAVEYFCKFGDYIVGCWTAWRNISSEKVCVLVSVMSVGRPYFLVIGSLSGLIAMVHIWFGYSWGVYRAVGFRLLNFQDVPLSKFSSLNVVSRRRLVC